MSARYTGVRKMEWDVLWHALFDVTGKDGKPAGESWDRVERDVALAIEAKLSNGQRAHRNGGAK